MIDNVEEKSKLEEDTKTLIDENEFMKYFLKKI